ncbi:IS3 family transposase [Actinoplanes sp. TRM 88003]|uniref:IS3 family transposase n=1 Tax=Paractinoplanes aksuensis TaxID=2939490 RepID=A0ABT1DMP6_9ACTN|nr:IS3 family transposase [Actinoplanes aksuensis]MCO8271315.1 IS3 family transposase [Actinoplanes aksuensis]
MTFIDEHRDRFAVALLLRVLNIAESTYYAWRKQAEQPCDRDLVDLGLLTGIHEIWEASGHTYGADRVHRQLRRDGIRVGRKRVERLMASQPRRVPAPGLARRLNETGPAAHAGAGSGQPPVHRGPAEPALGRRRHPHPHR